MNKYEVLYILDCKVEAAQKDALIEKYSALVKEYGGEVESVDKWGDRKLAYPIDYKSEGYYVLNDFLGKTRLSTGTGKTDAYRRRSYEIHGR